MAKRREGIEPGSPEHKKMLDEGRCLSCEFGPEAVEDFKHKATLAHGWTAVGGPDPDSPYGFYYQTEGLSTKFPGAFDIQIIYPLPVKFSHTLANFYIERHLMKGDFPKPGSKSSELLQDYTVEFAKIVVDGKILLRIILPDKENVTDLERMNKQYAGQWEGVLL